jgi:hypothetical protein
VGIDSSGLEFGSLSDDASLATQAQARISRTLTGLECESYFGARIRDSGVFDWFDRFVSWIAPIRDDCVKESAALSHFIQSQRLARAGDLPQAAAERALAGGYSRFARPVASIRADALRERARTHDDLADLNVAVDDLAAAYAIEAKAGDLRDILTAGERLAKDYKIDRAIAAYDKAASVRADLYDGTVIDRLTMFRYLNNLCWYASETATQVRQAMRFCDRAVAMESSAGLARDNRALARARVMDIPGAIADMEAYLAANEHAGGILPRREWLSRMRDASRTNDAQLVTMCSDTLVRDLGGDPSPPASRMKKADK